MRKRWAIKFTSLVFGLIAFMFLSLSGGGRVEAQGKPGFAGKPDVVGKESRKARGARGRSEDAREHAEEQGKQVRRRKGEDADDKAEDEDQGEQDREEKKGKQRKKG